MNILSENSMLVFILAIVWVLPWKAYALWTAARTRNKRWFIALIILNTFAILDIFYIFYIAKKTPKDLAKVFKSKL
jgi:hypothetical protein